MLVIFGLTSHAAPAHASKSKPDPLAGSGHGGFTFSIDPVPKWVSQTSPGSSARIGSAPMHYRLLEDQVLIDAAGQSVYTHYIRSVDDPAALSKAAQIETSFDPNYQTLSLHRVDVIRAGKRINKLDRAKVKLLQRETQLERQMYDGTVTASLIVDDVRSGDEVEVAYTIKGSNPVFDGHAVNTLYLTSDRGPVALDQVRIIHPINRNIDVKLWDASIKVERRPLGAQEEILIDAGARDQIQNEPNESYFSLAPQWVMYQEFDSWNAVAKWGMQLFKENGAEAPSVDAKAKEIAAAYPDAKDRLLAALKFVQADVRYFGTEFGAGSHRPAPPEQVFNQRYGDCKDKVMLLMALLHRMQIEATPVLVSTYLRSHLSDMPPSPLDFNHVIARVDLDGKTYYLDGTRNHQTGPLQQRSSTGLGKGLLLAESTSAPINLPSAFDILRVELKDTITVADMTQDMTLESRQTFYGDTAEGMRTLLADKPPAEVATLLNSWYQRLYPNVRTVAPMEIEDATDEDKVTVVQHFALDNLATLVDGRTLRVGTLAWGLADALRIPNQEKRLSAYVLVPGRMVQDVELRFPIDLYTHQEPKSLEDSDQVSEVKVVINLDARKALYHDELRLRAEDIDPSQWNAHSTFVKQNLEKFGNTLMIPLLNVEQLKIFNDAAQRLKADTTSGKVKYFNARQSNAELQRLFFSGALQSNRLPAKARATVLAGRGDALDTLGFPEEGSKDFTAALSLQPDDPVVLVYGAMNALETGDYAKAIELSSHLIESKPADEGGLTARAVAYYMHGDYAQSIADLQSVLQSRTALERGTPLLWLSLAVRRSGGDVKAALAPYAEAGLSENWPRALIDVELGKSTAEEALKIAKTGDPAKLPSQGATLFFQWGEEALINGHNQAAIADFQGVVKEGLNEMVETSLSKRRLAELK
jgi:lipoprotein NlpI/transglutaminase-like putative cysteine protease